jgi:chemotaxis protein CheC
MNDIEVFSEEQMDFLREMMNIGAGNAGTAFTQMLQRQVEVRIPALHILPIAKVPSILGDPSLLVLCARMGIVGDTRGELFFIVPDEHKKTLAHLVEGAAPGSKKNIPDVDLSVLTEVGNIIAGVYLTAIHDFCGLNIYHSVPTVSIDMIQSLLDESLAMLSSQVSAILLVENEFAIAEKRIRTFLLVVPTMVSVKILIDSIEQARHRLIGEGILPDAE